MKKLALQSLLAVAIMLLTSVSAIAAGTIELKSLSFNNIGMGGRLIRMGDNGILIDNAGMHLEGQLNMRVNGYMGQRLICAIAPVDAEGYSLADGNGNCIALVAFKVTSNQFTKNLPIEIPYTWIQADGNSVNLTFDVTILNSSVEEVAHKVITLNPNDVNIDRSNIGNKMLGDVLGFGGDGGSEADLMGGLIGGLLGGPSASQEYICNACDGTGLCPECYGDAFFNPSICRRCAQDPGICRRCKGAKKETVDVDIYGL